MDVYYKYKMNIKPVNKEKHVNIYLYDIIECRNP